MYLKNIIFICIIYWKKNSLTKSNRLIFKKHRYNKK